MMYFICMWQYIEEGQPSLFATASQRMGPLKSEAETLEYASMLRAKSEWALVSVYREENGVVTKVE